MSSSSSSPPARVASSNQIASNASSASLNTAAATSSAPPSNVWPNSKDDYDLGEVIGVGATGKILLHNCVTRSHRHSQLTFCFNSNSRRTFSIMPTEE
jgi:serine/threonine-protein kinase OSR1/STK39